MRILDCTDLKLSTVSYVDAGIGWREFELRKLSDNVYILAAQPPCTLHCYDMGLTGILAARQNTRFISTESGKQALYLDVGVIELTGRNR